MATAKLTHYQPAEMLDTVSDDLINIPPAKKQARRNKRILFSYLAQKVFLAFKVLLLTQNPELEASTYCARAKYFQAVHS